MANIILIVIAWIAPALAFAQEDSIVVPEPATLDLSFLIAETMINNPEIQEALSRWDALEASAGTAGSLPYPELKFMQEEMPGFSFSEAMYSRLELMQTIPFPTKLSSRSEIAGRQAEHAHHDHLEVVNDVIARLRRAYFELWFNQQNIVLDRENARLLGQIESIARERFALGSVSQQDVLRAQIERTAVAGDLISLRQKELSSKAALMSILNRPQHDTLGFAVIADTLSFDQNLDSLIARALQSRPMIQHESLRVDEENSRLRLAKQEYLPDFTLGLERVTSPATGFNGWSVRAGITLPFAPWTIGRVSAGVDEEAAMVNLTKASYDAARLMVIANIRDLYYKSDALKKRLDLYRMGVLPQARQSLTLTLKSYSTGETDFLRLNEAFREYVNYTKEYFMTRMNFEVAVADLEREVGVNSLSSSN
jgi:outer membrane protein TolC